MSNTNTARRPRLPRTMADLASHPWVESISDERSSGDGLWVYLKPGYVWDGDVGSIHESTVKACCQEFRSISFDQAVKSELEAVPAPVEAAPVEAAPAPRRRLNPLAEMLLMRLQATNRDWLLVEVCPIVGTLKGLGWIVTRHDYGKGVECQITVSGRHVLAARPCDGEAEAAPVEAAPVEAAPVEAAPVEAAIGRWLESVARAVAAVAVALYAAGLTLGAAVHALNDWLAGVAPAPAPAPARLARPAVHPFAVITAAALDGLTGAAVAVAV